MYLKEVDKLIRKKNLKNYILRNENAVYHECGYSCDNVIFIRLGKENFFVTDGRYAIEAKEDISKEKNIEVIETNNLIKTVRQILRKNKIKRIDFDPNDFSVADFERLTNELDTKFIKKPFFSKNKRIIKTDKEIELLAIAAQLGRDGFVRFASYIHEKGLDKSEQYLHFKAKELMSNHGEFDLSFDPIVAINENSAKPHALPTDKKLQKDDLLLMDAGVKYLRYCSDRTVTTINGYNKKQKKVYNIVLKAQQKAIQKIRVGMKASDIDKIARDVIEKAGFGKQFVHSTGHGVGLDIHELPIISSKNKIVIEENMVFTIEPGIYLPGEFGIRIEDTVVIKNGKAIVL